MIPKPGHMNEATSKEYLHFVPLDTAGGESIGILLNNWNKVLAQLRKAFSSCQKVGAI